MCSDGRAISILFIRAAQGPQSGSYKVPFVEEICLTSAKKTELTTDVTTGQNCFFYKLRESKLTGVHVI
jgi:hypothetical protein